MALSGLHTIPCRPKIKFEPKYLGYYMNGPQYHKQLFPLMQGIKVLSISKANISKTIIRYPSIDVQKKQTQILSLLDKKIRKQNELINCLKSYKRGLLSRLFSKKGETVPALRFRDFTNDWDQRKVYEITSSYSGGTPQAGNSEYYDGEIPFIRSGEIYKDQTELFITQIGMDNSSAKMVSKGDILYALYGATSGEVSRARLDGAINQAILAIIPNEKYNANFLVEWFRKEKDNIIDKYLQGGQGKLSAQIKKN